jgi:ribosomal protein L19
VVSVRKYYTGITQENQTICIKEGEYIRNIIDEEDIETGLLVFVNNIDKVTVDINTHVRNAIVNLSFR